MEENKLSKEDLEQLNNLYYELTATLKSYKAGMRRKDYKQRFNETQRAKIEAQNRFFKTALNEALITLMDQRGLKVTTGKDALKNPFVIFSTKWKVSGYLRHINLKARLI